MKIVLIRHFEVDFKWKQFYNSSEYEAAREGYNSAPVLAKAVQITAATRLITSTMSRAIETCKILFNRQPDRCEDALCEVPIKSFAKTKLRLPKAVWDVVGRVQWWLNSRHQPERYTQSKERVNQFIDDLANQKEDVVVVCHGWVMKLMIKRLRKIGFQGPNPLFIKNGFPYEFSR